MRLIRINELQPRNYNSLSSYKYRCASCVPTNYNIEECCEEDASYGALHAHQRITTARPGEIQRKPRVRSVRTNELQHHTCHPAQKQSGCAPRAPMNYNQLIPMTSMCYAMVRLVHTHELQLRVLRQQRERFGALRAHPRITTARHATSLRRLPVRLVRAHELQQLCQCQKYHLGWCAPCAPTNYNDFAGLIQPIEAGAFCVHQ